MHELVICGQLGFSLQEGTFCSITWNVSPTGRWEVGDWPHAPGTLLCKTLRQEGREMPGTLDVGRQAVCRELPITALRGNHGTRGCRVVGHSHQPPRARAPPGNWASPLSHREAGTGPLFSLRHTSFSFEHQLIGYQRWAGFIWSGAARYPWTRPHPTPTWPTWPPVYTALLFYCWFAHLSHQM